MWKLLGLFLVGVFASPFLQAQAVRNVLDSYNVKWTTQSANSPESMPCGGGDIGLNVWVEGDDLLFYIARSGTFDENNMMPKLGRIRIQMDPNPFSGGKFEQTLKLYDGYVEIRGENGGGEAVVKIWTEIERPVIHVEVVTSRPTLIKAFYENWRYQDRLLRRNEGFGTSYKWELPEGLTTHRDSIRFDQHSVLFFHRNKGETVFDAAVRQQGLEQVADSLFNPLKNLTFGGRMQGKNMLASSVVDGSYLDTPFKGWLLESASPSKSHHVEIALHTAQEADLAVWQKELDALQSDRSLRSIRREVLDWWHDLWDRSHVFVRPLSSDTADVAWQTGKNYQLFRYMLACNAYGSYPTKFNGGLFTYDPEFVNPDRSFTPDFRNWGGGTFTAQNQRLVYFPMFRSGDMDMLTSQLDFYLNLLGTAELRSKVYWGHDGASFTEQIENFGLPNPTEYGWKRPDYFDSGIEYNAWLEYQWDTALEFCWMALELHHYQKVDIQKYLPLIKSCLVFFEEHYKYQSRMRGRRELSGDGHLVFYPGTACETYKMAYNPTSTIVALETVLDALLKLPAHYLTKEERVRFEAMGEAIPPISFREFNGHKTIAPAWMWERINNTEVPQLYPVYPWGVYGVGKPDLEVARNTYLYDEDVLKFRGHESWKQDNIFAARLGLTEEAVKYTTLKLKDSGRRFPTFWGPGFDWVPDHNWGGSGMIGLQEMLLQTHGQRLLLFPAWPEDWDVQFKLHAPDNTIVEGELKAGMLIRLDVSPHERTADVELFNPLIEKKY
jgi:hypothetical protein